MLEKTYFMLPEDDGVLEKAEGTKIDWKAGGSPAYLSGNSIVTKKGGWRMRVRACPAPRLMGLPGRLSRAWPSSALPRAVCTVTLGPSIRGLARSQEWGRDGPGLHVAFQRANARLSASMRPHFQAVRS